MDRKKVAKPLFPADALGGATAILLAILDFPLRDSVLPVFGFGFVQNGFDKAIEI